MRRKRKWLALLPIALIAAGSVACGGGGDADDNGDASTPAPTTTAASGGGVTGEASREIEVIATDNLFTPDEIRMEVGETVTIEFKNQGAAIHNMHVLSSATEGTDYRSDPLVNPGAEDSFDVQFSQAGTYKFQCDLHLPGMVGEIIVE